MSRIANSPIELPSGVEANISKGSISVKGGNGTLQLDIDDQVNVLLEENQLKLSAKKDDSKLTALTGTTRALINNMVIGVTKGFEKKLTLIGVGYRAKVQGKVINIVVGYSHPIDYELPEGITAETPSQTEIIIKGADKQRVGQVAAEIRKFRPPEPYKGKGIRYTDEHVFRKEAKKK